MIDTIKMYFPISYTEVQNLKAKLGIPYQEINQFFAGKFPGVTMSISCQGNGKWKLYLVVNAVKLLSKPGITENDYEELEKQIKFVLWNVLGNSSFYKEHVLLRIDYRYDVVIPNQVTRKLLLDLYKKLTRSHSYQKKFLGKVNNYGVFELYETTVYHSSGSVHATVYLKNEEGEAKGKELEEYEKNVIRFEVRLLQDHINYMARKDNPRQRPKKLKAYLKAELFVEYFRKYLSQIYHSGDFYKLDEARKIISKSQLSTINKTKLVDFLKKVSSNDMDTPFKSLSENTYRSRLKSLKSLGINPVPIPKNYPKAPNTIENPLNRFPW